MARETGENEHHVVGVRMRATGFGNLKLRLTDLDQKQIQDLVDWPLELTTRFEKTRLSNFQSQRIRFEIRLEEINEHFMIRRILLFAKPVAVEYPA